MFLISSSLSLNLMLKAFVTSDEICFWTHQLLIRSHKTGKHLERDKVSKGCSNFQ